MEKDTVILDRHMYDNMISKLRLYEEDQERYRKKYQEGISEIQIYFKELEQHGYYNQRYYVTSKVEKITYKIIDSEFEGKVKELFFSEISELDRKTTAFEKLLNSVINKWWFQLFYKEA